MMLHEKKRPKNFGEMVAQEKAVTQLLRYGGADGKGYGGRALWIAGQSGTGKTTLAEIVALRFAGENINITRLLGRDVTPRHVEVFASAGLRSPLFGNLTGHGHVLLVNDAQYMIRAVVEKLQGALERKTGMTDKLCYIFTANVESDRLEGMEEAPFFFSRLDRIYLARQGLAQPFAEHCKKVAADEGLDGQPIEKYMRLAKDCGNNLREMLCRVDAGVMAAKE